MYLQFSVEHWQKIQPAVTKVILKEVAAGNPSDADSEVKVGHLYSVFLETSRTKKTARQFCSEKGISDDKLEAVLSDPENVLIKSLAQSIMWDYER